MKHPLLPSAHCASNLGRHSPRTFKTLLALMMLPPTFVGGGCADQGTRDIASDAVVTSLFGSLDMEVVEKDKLTSVEKSLGSLQVVLFHEGQRFATPVCTGVRISSRHLLTAHHCVQESLIFNPDHHATLPHDGTVRVQLFDRTVRLAYGGTLDPQSETTAQEAPVLAAPVFKDERLDFAVFELPVSQNLGHGDHHFVDLRTVATVPSEQRVPLDAFGEKSLAVYLYGYPHGLPLTRSTCPPWVPEKQASAEKRAVKGHDKGERSHSGEKSMPWVFHPCDAANGLSGGLLVQHGQDPHQGPEQKALALHLAGPGLNDGAYYREQNTFETPEIFAARKRCPHTPSDTCRLSPVEVVTLGLNRALPLSTVAQAISTQSPQLWQALDAASEASQKEDETPPKP